MKKKILMFICFLSFFLPLSVMAIEEMTYDEATEAMRQSIQAWYMRGSYIQYNSSKCTYHLLRHPEDATVQDTTYTVCSGFTNDAWMETFGFTTENDGPGGNTPAASSAYGIEARQYIDAKGCTTSNPTKPGCSGEVVLYYYNKSDNKSYYYNPDNLSTSEIKKYSNFVKNLQPGDVVSYNGHIAMVYDFKYDSKGNKIDALLIESGSRGELAYTRIDPDEASTTRLYLYKAKKENNGLLDINGAYQPYLGTIQWRWLSNFKAVVKNGQVTCASDKEHCSITRSYHKGSNGKAVLNYDVEWPQQIKASKARIELPGIFIQKTSSKYDNNSIILGDTITYTIRIINNSNLATINGQSKSKKYTSFHVVENIPDEVEFIDTAGSNINGTYNSTNKTVAFDISSLSAGETVLLKYKVKVKTNAKNIGKFVESEGKVYKSSSDNYITTGVVSNEIINTTSATAKQYKDCFEKSKKEGATSLNLIQKTYSCVYGDDLDFTFNSFSTSGNNMLERLINKPITNPSKAPSRGTAKIRLNTAGQNKIFADMILNQYWGGLTKSNNGTTCTEKACYYLPYWRNEGSGQYIGDIKRAETIMSSHFKNGDVLIYSIDNSDTKSNLLYTKENGLYAFIYIDDSFVGVNYAGNANERNSFTKDYYTSKGLDLTTKLYNGSANFYDYANLQTIMGKDSYVILRPEKVITEVTKIVIKEEPTKKNYYQNQTLDVTGGVITATNNDGTKEDINMTDSDVKITGYNSKTIGQQEITVTYKGKSASFNVTVNENSVSSISVHTNPNKTVYYVGDKLDLTGGVFTVHYVNGSTKNYSMSNSNLTVSGYDSSSAGVQTITLSYSNKRTTFDVQVNEIMLQTVSIQKYPNKLIYNEGENLDLTGGKLLLKYNNGSTQSISMSDSSITCSGYNNHILGTQTISLNVGGKTVTFEVAVNINTSSEEVSLESISVYSNPAKTNYHIGEELDLTGGKLKLIYHKTTNDTVTVVYDYIDMNNDNVSVTGFSSSSEGTKTLTVTYSEKTTSFDVVVSERKLVRIEVTKLPRKKKYIQYQEDLKPNEGSITLTYNDNTSEDLALTDSEVELLDFDNTKLGEQQIIVIYKGLETSFPVTVYETAEEAVEDDLDGPLSKVEIMEGLDKTEYIKGVDSFDITGIVLRVFFENGDHRNVDLSDYPGLYTVSGYDNTKEGEQTVTVTYKGFDLQFKVNIVSKDSVIFAPDTLSKKSLLIIVFGILCIVSGTVIIYKNTKRRKEAI